MVAQRSESTSLTSRSAEQVLIGRAGRAHGLRGDISVELRTDEPERRFAPGAQVWTETGAELVVAANRWHSGRLYVRFANYLDRSSVEGLRGELLYAWVSDQEQPTDPDEFYVRQLVGMTVVTVTGEHLGTVGDVLALPGQDVVVVTRPDATETLVPFVADIVVSVDLTDRELRMDPPAGLLELGAQDPSAAQSDPGRDK